MGQTIYEKFLDRELGATRKPAKVLRSLYGDRFWAEDLDIVNELPGHSGCVNALSWSKSGRLLASGSDDTHLNIHSYQPQDSLSQFKLSTTVATGHRANIFSVKFMPHSNDRTLITAAGDSEVRIFDIEYAGRNTGASTSTPASDMYARRGIQYLSDGDTNCRVYRSHNDRVKRIVTESSAHLFLTCSEDGEVRQWDLRQPSSAYPRPSGSRGRPSLVSEDGGVVPPPLISYRRYHLDLNSISCSASQPHYIVLGGAHLHVFLHDRRMLGRDRIAERGGSVSTSGYSDHDDEMLAEATQCVRRFAPHGKKKMKRQDNGHVTACKISDTCPNEMVASWSGDWIYSFDLARSPDARNASENVYRKSVQRNSRVGRVKDSAERKWKRAAAGSADGAARAESRIRSTPPVGSQSSGEQVSLRVRYVNGQSEDIAVDTPPEESDDTGEQQKAEQIANYTYRLRRFMFSEGQRNGDETQDTVGRSATFTQALRWASLIHKHVDEISRTWRYPMEPDALDVAVQRTHRENRESIRQFVQASGTIARLLGGTLDDPQQLQRFVNIAAPRQHSKLPTQGERFSYDFLKAIVLWLNSGPGALIEGFTSSHSSRQQNTMCPIPEDSASIESIDDTLIPYLLELASVRRIRNVDASRFEVEENRYLFSSEKAAVRAFADAVRTPFEDLSTNTFMSGEHYGTPFLRKDAILFWGYRVARGVLLNAGLEISSTFIHQALGGVGRPGRKLLGRETALNRTLGLLDDPEEGEDERMDDAVDSLKANRFAPRAGEVGGQSTRSDGDQEEESSSDEDLIAVDDVRAIMAEAPGVDDEEEEEDVDEEESNDDQDSDIDMNSDQADEEDEEEEESDSDASNPADLMSAFHATASTHSSLRSSVQSHVPCSSHLRTYKGHCNVRTVKDVNYFGLNDEYVVSGSDDGNLFIWARATGELVNILSGDGEVVNVVQGHPYEPTLAVSGIDNTIKIFSPDARAQRAARRGVLHATQTNRFVGRGNNNPRDRRAAAAAPAQAEEPTAWEHPHVVPHVLAAARARQRQQQQQQRNPSHPSPEIETQQDPEATNITNRPVVKYKDHDSTSEDSSSSSDERNKPPRTRLASRRRMQDAEDILAHNNKERQGGNRDAYITQGMLASIWTRMMEQRANRAERGGAGGVDGADEDGGGGGAGGGGRVIVSDDDCRIM